MNLSVSLSGNQITFNSKYVKYSKESMDKVLLPLLQEENADIKTLVSKSGYTNHAIINWFKKSIGVTAAKFFNNKKQEILKQQMIEFDSQGLSYSDVAKHYGLSPKWAYNQFVKLGLKIKRTDFNKRLDEELPKMIAEGFTVKEMAKKNNCSTTVIYNWIDKNLNNSIVKYRHENNIKLKYDYSDVNIKEKELMRQYFSEGKNIKQVAELMGMSSSKVCLLRDKYGLKTEKNYARERMIKMVPKMMKEKLSIVSMSKLIGVSKATIARWIKSVHGKSYIEIRRGR